MSRPERVRVHLVVGGYPPGSGAAHDMDYARLRILELLRERPEVTCSVAGDYADLERWLDRTRLLITYVAGPYPDDERDRLLRDWLDAGGRWLGMHGTSGGRAARVGERGLRRKMVKGRYHDTLGSFFLNHPPIRRFRVEVADRGHALTRGLPESFEVDDELYLIELQQPEASRVLLTTEIDEDPSPPGFGFVYDEELLSPGTTRVLGYVKQVGRGEVAYLALGHCHSPTTNAQPFVDASVVEDGTTPELFRGAWETPELATLLRNGIAWGVGLER